MPNMTLAILAPLVAAPLRLHVVAEVILVFFVGIGVIARAPYMAATSSSQ